MRALLATLLVAAFGGAASAQEAPAYDAAVFAAAEKIQPRVVAWRRDIHQHPELSGQETRTAKLAADHLKRLGYEVRTGIGGAGVVGVLNGGKPGKVAALRADMDALPVAEQTNLPFASKVTATWKGAKVPVMHACGHDAHTAMLMGAAEILASMRESIAGTVVIVFQPAEEGREDGQSGADLMMKANALANPKPDAMFGLHVFPGEAGALYWRSGPFMASSDSWTLKVTGKQTHGAQPWDGIDAASVAADIVTSFNQIAARQLNVAHAPTVLTIGEIHLGTRPNIIPGEFDMTGTLRTFDPQMRKQTLAAIDKALEAMSVKYGAKAEFKLSRAPLPVTSNDPALTAKVKRALSRAAVGKVSDNGDYVMPSEDFSYYQTLAPTVFYHLGVGGSAPNHSPMFDIDEKAMQVGVRAHVLATLDFLSNQ